MWILRTLTRFTGVMYLSWKNGASIPFYNEMPTIKKIILVNTIYVWCTWLVGVFNCVYNQLHIVYNRKRIESSI
jgi:hypothetical protein